MKLLIEEHPYEATDELLKVLDGLFTLQNVEGKISVSYVGYYYNPNIKDCVFILPKVIINEYGKAFNQFDPAEIIDVEKSKLSKEQKKFLYEFAVWIHRAITVFRDTEKEKDSKRNKEENDRQSKSKIIHSRQIQGYGHGMKRESNTLLDIILSPIRFNREHQNFFTTILKNLHSGFNKINWGRTISNSTAIVESEEPVYLRPVNKKRQINFDEELIVIFFSILNYIKDAYGFRSHINFGFDLITGNKFKKYLNGHGRTRLRQIKYKYFSDTALRMWDLCYAFFDKTHKIKMSTQPNEYLLVSSFHIVFEAIIDELIGDKDVPKGLKEQEDGKLIDHFYTYDGLIVDRDQDNDIYYIGDSKYYKLGSDLGSNSIYKQYTYARNVIQWNLNLFLDPKSNPEDYAEYGSFELRDKVTEGYNIIPNFFISADIDAETLSYKENTHEHGVKPKISRQFENRLYDRDTLLLSHYDVNFLFVLALYARDNSSAKAEWKIRMRKTFREAIQETLRREFDFSAMRAKPGVNADEFMHTNFQDVLGKVFRPYEDKGIFSLALEKGHKDNEKVLSLLGKSFDIVPIRLGDDPAEKIPAPSPMEIKLSSVPKRGVLLLTVLNKDSQAKLITSPQIAVGIKYTEDYIDILENKEKIGHIIIHKKQKATQVVLPVKNVSLSIGKNVPPLTPTYPNDRDLYLIFDVDHQDTDLREILDCMKANPKYDAVYSTLDDLRSNDLI